MEKGYAGPILPTNDDGKFIINIQFVRDMIQWFKDGKSIPRRYRRLLLMNRTLSIPTYQVRVGDPSRRAFVFRKGGEFSRRLHPGRPDDRCNWRCPRYALY